MSYDEPTISPEKRRKLFVRKLEKQPGWHDNKHVKTLSEQTVDEEHKLDELVRDLTKVGSIPKSEARRRIQEYALGKRQNIGFLRQWINEKPADLLVTNEDIERFLNL